MKEYDIRPETLGCHCLMDVTDYDEALAAILRWWQGIKDETKTLSAIQFWREDDATLTVEVFWSTLPPDIRKKVDEALASPIKLPQIEDTEVSKN